MNIHTPQVIFLVGLVSYVAIREVYQRRVAGNEGTVKRSSASDRLLVVLVFIGQAIVPGLYLFTPWLNGANYELPRALAWLGAVITAAGLWVFWRSHADLGKNWSVTLELQSDHRLVTHGVYRMVRHPMYSSFLLFGIGQALLLANWLAGPSALIAVALLCVFRVPREEAMMCEHFGQEYREYMQRSGSVVPWVGLGRDA
jgi:protein-S-isoprenylcysteine O-methyltransferase Ste14